MVLGPENYHFSKHIIMTVIIFIQVAENGFFTRFEFVSSKPETAKAFGKKNYFGCDI